jgi:uncharacterized protein YacL
MNNNLKKVVGAVATGATFLGATAPAFANGTSLNPCNGSGPFGKLCNLNANNLGSIIGGVITTILVIAVLIALFYLIWGGIAWITSGGDKANVEKARGRIIAAIVGLVIAFLAFFILSLVLQVFGLSLANMTIPTINGL